MKKQSQPNPSKQWAYRLGLIRKLHGLSQAKFGASIGVSKETYQWYEKGEREPRFDTLRKLRAIYKISLDVLICGDQISLEVVKEFDFAHASEAEKNRYLEAVAKATEPTPVGVQPRIQEPRRPPIRSPARPKPQ